MADIADQSDTVIEESMADRLGDVRRVVESIDAGSPGECEYCGEMKPRVVRGACGRCRDEFKLG